MTSAPALALIPCAAIDPSPDQNRKVFDADELRTLADNIAEVGQLQPLCVRLSDSPGLPGTGGPRYTLIAGERRLRALRDVLQRETALCIVKDQPDALMRALATLGENLCRVDTNPIEDAQGLLDAMTYGATPAELAEKLGKSTRWVRDRLALLELADDVAHWIQTKDLPIERGVMMSGLDVNRQRLALAAHETGRLDKEAFRALCGRLADEQAADSMFDTADFLRVDEYVVEAEAEVAPPAPVVVREELLGIAEIAQLLAVKPATVHQWRARGRFPDPERHVGGSPAWWESTVRAWASETGR